MINIDKTEEESECYQCDYKATYFKLMYHKRRTHMISQNSMFQLNATKQYLKFKCDQCECSSESSVALMEVISATIVMIMTMTMVVSKLIVMKKN